MNPTGQAPMNRDLLRAVIADDEAGARAHLRALLEASRVRIVGECASGSEVAPAVARVHPDLVCLDVRMPDLDGLEVARRLHPRPAVVFTSGYADYAAAAFEIGAADYLLKPLSAARLGEAMRRVRTGVRRADAGDELVAGTSTTIPAAGREAVRFPRIFIPQDDHRIALAPEAIRYVEAREGVCVVHTDGTAYRLRISIAQLERLLAGFGFVRTHRAYLVNLRCVRALVPWSRHVHSLLLDGGQETHVPVAKSRLAAFRGSVIWIPHAGGQRSGPGAAGESGDRGGREPGIGPRHRGGTGL